MITSRSNSKIKQVRKLLSSAAERRKTGLFVIEGSRLFAEAPKATVREVFVSGQLQNLDLSGYPSVETVDPGLFRELSDTVHPQGILAVVQTPVWEKPVFADTKDALADGHGYSVNPGGRILMLDGIRDPGNLGTMIRTAEAAGVRAVFMSPDCVDLYNPKVIRSTMGSIFRVPAFREDLTRVIRKLYRNQIPVYAASLEGARSYRDVELSGAAIIIGSEADGVSRPVLDLSQEHIKIPMAGKVESLNAAVSAAILLFS